MSGFCHSHTRRRSPLPSFLLQEIHEIEERKNTHINELMKKHERAFAEIKNYYNDITHNNLDLIKTLKVLWFFWGEALKKQTLNMLCCTTSRRGFRSGAVSCSIPKGMGFRCLLSSLALPPASDLIPDRR
mgnify:CR=1 FL=1